MTNQMLIDPDRIYLHWELGEDKIKEIYDTAVAEHVLPIVAPELKDCSDHMFKKYAASFPVFGTKFNDEGKPLGFFYLTNFEGATARLHFCYFKAGRKDRIKLGRRVLNYCYEVFQFKALIGIIPCINHAAIGYAHEMGGKFMGMIPGICYIARRSQIVAGAQFIFTP